MANSICSKIWMHDIGHYGGMFVDIPVEHYPSFKKHFPKSTWPKKVKEKQIAETVGSDEIVIRFDRKFPKSKGKIRQVYFRDGSKGLQIYDKLTEKCPIVRYGERTHG